MPFKKYLVTGGTGFIGSNLVRRLIKEGHHVRVLDNDSRGNIDRLKDVSSDIEFITSDIRDAVKVESACRGIDSVFHLAFINGTEFFYTKPDLVLDVGVKGMVNILDACIKNKINELYLASSSEVYQLPPLVPTDETAPLSIPDPLNPRYSYGAGKIISEIMAINYGRKLFERVVIFRPHNIYGPNMGWEHVIPQFILRMNKICRATNDHTIKFPIQGTGQETRAFCFIEDFVDGLMILKDKGEHLGIYHIGTQEELTIEKVAKEIARYFNKNIQIVSGALAKGGTPRRCPDISKMQTLGYQPKINFSHGAHLTAQWYDQNADKAPEQNKIVSV